MKKLKCGCGHWEVIDGFVSPNEYKAFVVYIENEVREDVAEEVPAEPEYNEGLIYGGRWFKCKDCKKIWRLVEPDFPFKGLWKPLQKL